MVALEEVGVRKAKRQVRRPCLEGLVARMTHSAMAEIQVAIYG